ncbi:MAG: hypothetical protein GDA56_14065 [Hormoscilla sp. GM7CHS1pb]|nr:hypothetical protein [Hormoscilla sp. GM7CHS1pb]
MLNCWSRIILRRLSGLPSKSLTCKWFMVRSGGSNHRSRTVGWVEARKPNSPNPSRGDRIRECDRKKIVANQEFSCFAVRSRLKPTKNIIILAISFTVLTLYNDHSPDRLPIPFPTRRS